MIPQHMRTAVHAGIAVALLAVGVRTYQADPEWVVAQATVWSNYACAVGGILLLVVVHLVVDNWAALFGTVEEGLEQHGGQLVANVLKAHGVKFLFTLVGGHISPILVASKASGIRVVDVRHEVNAVFAADAVARLTGVPGVAAVTAGPGLTNTITAVKNAQMAESPLVLIGGAAATLAKGRGALQDIDQMSVLKPIVKYAATCDSVRDIVPVLRKAFQEASSGTPGPVFVEFPLDVLYPVMEVRASLSLTKRMRKEEIKTESQVNSIIVPAEAKRKGMSCQQYLDTRSDLQAVFLAIKPRISPFVVAYLNFCLRRLFANAFNRTWDYTPLPVHTPTHSQSQIRKTLSLLANARHPVALVASQAMVDANEVDGLAANLHELGIPCFLGGMARGLLGRNSKMHVRQNRRGALKQADVILMVGSYCDFRLDYGRVLPKSAKVIAINRSSFHLKRNTDLFWKPTMACLADPSNFIKDLVAQIRTKSWFEDRKAGWADFAAQLKEAEAAKEAANAKKAQQPSFGRAVTGADGTATRKQLLNPVRLVSDLEQVLSDKSILIGDGGDFIATAAYVLRPRGPLTWLDPGAFGTLGVGGGFALGAKLCKPDHDVWLLWGDGSVGYSVAEFDTFKRHNVPIVALIGNDACWTQIEREQIPMFGDDVACPLEYTAYNEVARHYGGDGVMVSDPNEDLQAVLRRAQDAARHGTPMCVNALIGSSDFRKGSISV